MIWQSSNGKIIDFDEGSMEGHRMPGYYVWSGDVSFGNKDCNISHQISLVLWRYGILYNILTGLLLTVLALPLYIIVMCFMKITMQLLSFVMHCTLVHTEHAIRLTVWHVSIWHISQSPRKSYLILPHWVLLWKITWIWTIHIKYLLDICDTIRRHKEVVSIYRQI